MKYKCYLIFLLIFVSSPAFGMKWQISKFGFFKNRILNLFLNKIILRAFCCGAIYFHRKDCNHFNCDFIDLYSRCYTPKCQYNKRTCIIKDRSTTKINQNPQAETKSDDFALLAMTSQMTCLSIDDLREDNPESESNKNFNESQEKDEFSVSSNPYYKGYETEHSSSDSYSWQGSSSDSSSWEDNSSDSSDGSSD